MTTEQLAILIVDNHETRTLFPIARRGELVDLIVAAIEQAKKEQRQKDASRAIDWATDKERGDYDTYSAASAISAAIRNQENDHE